MGCCLSCKLDYDLQKKDNSLKYFSFDGLKTRAKVVDIYDGDTCSIVFLYRGEYIKYKTRAYGYDTCEIHPRKTINDREKVMASAQLQKICFSNMLNYNKGLIDVQLMGFDKYGRILAVYYGENKEISINTKMVEEYGATPYFGGTKV
jgi:endonuclease YncB( thermonuclease family)